MNFKIFLMMLLWAVSAQAQAPVPERKTNSLEIVQQKIAEQERQKAQLSGELKQKDRELQGTRKELVSLGEKMQASEKSLADLNERIAKLSRDEEALSTKLKGDYSAMAELVLGLERMRRIPPEALIVRPGAPLETAQTAMLLRSALPAVQGRAAQLSEDLTRLQTIHASLEKDREKSQGSAAELAQKKKEMAALLSKRESYHKQIGKALGESEKNLRGLAAQAQNLKELVSRIEEQEQRTAVASSGGKTQKVSLASRDLPDVGRTRLPVPGKVIARYGQRDEIGAESQGVKFETASGATVVAPMGGKIRFTDYFKNYGKLVIIEHKNGFHSLLAGFQKIDVKVGQSVSAGEPVGILPLTSSRGGRPALYYELRFKGNPVDPAQKLPDIRS